MVQEPTLIFKLVPDRCETTTWNGPNLRHSEEMKAFACKRVLWLSSFICHSARQHFWLVYEFWNLCMEVLYPCQYVQKCAVRHRPTCVSTSEEGLFLMVNFRSSTATSSSALCSDKRVLTRAVFPQYGLLLDCSFSLLLVSLCFPSRS